LTELEVIVGSGKYAYYAQKVGLLPDENDLTDEEKLIILKLFDFAVPIAESDSVTLENVNRLKKIIQETDLKSLLTSPLLRSLMKSPEFYLLINNCSFRDLMTEERLLTLIRSPEFKDLLNNPNFKEILARNGLIIPLKPFDLQLSFRLSLLKSIAKLERIFEDFRTNRCAEYTPILISKPVRSTLAGSLSPRRQANSSFTRSVSPFESSSAKGKTQTNSCLNILSKQKNKNTVKMV